MKAITRADVDYIESLLFYIAVKVGGNKGELLDYLREWADRVEQARVRGDGDA